jgi:hypothetical protein
LSTKGQNAEAEGRYEDAAHAYEGFLTEDPLNLEAFLNLLVLYWQVTDYGFNSGHKLDLAFVHRSGQRLPEMLAFGLKEFGLRPEFTFWSNYIRWVDLGEEPDPEACRRSLREHPHYLEPAMYVFLVTEGEEAEAEALLLMEILRAKKTVRASYVLSVVESALAQRDFERRTQGRPVT